MDNTTFTLIVLLALAVSSAIAMGAVVVMAAAPWLAGLGFVALVALAIFSGERPTAPIGRGIRRFDL